MNPTDAYAHEFAQEGATTRALIEAIPEDKYTWRAHDKAMTLGELCRHVCDISANMPGVLGGATFDIRQRSGPGPAPTSRREALEVFDTAMAGVTTWLRELGPRAQETWTLYSGEQELMAMPRAAAVRSLLLNHTYHHRGQLSAYLRAASVAVPSVYGPTADVDPFA